MEGDDALARTLETHAQSLAGLKQRLLNSRKEREREVASSPPRPEPNRLLPVPVPFESPKTRMRQPETARNTGLPSPSFDEEKRRIMQLAKESLTPDQRVRTDVYGASAPPNSAPRPREATGRFHDLLAEVEALAKTVKELEAEKDDLTQAHERQLSVLEEEALRQQRLVAELTGDLLEARASLGDSAELSAVKKTVDALQTERDGLVRKVEQLERDAEEREQLIQLQDDAMKESERRLEACYTEKENLSRHVGHLQTSHSLEKEQHDASLNNLTMARNELQTLLDDANSSIKSLVLSLHSPTKSPARPDLGSPKKQGFPQLTRPHSSDSVASSDTATPQGADARVHEDLHRSILDLRDQLSKNVREKAALADKLRTVNGSEASLKVELARLQTVHDDATERLSTAHHTIRRLEDDVRRLQNGGSSGPSRSRSEMDEMSARIDSLTNELESKQDCHQRTLKELTESEDRWKRMQREMAQNAEDSRTHIAHLTSLLSDREEHLSELARELTRVQLERDVAVERADQLKLSTQAEDAVLAAKKKCRQLLAHVTRQETELVALRERVSELESESAGRKWELDQQRHIFEVITSP